MFDEKSHLTCMMTSFDYSYQNALRQAIVFGIFSFVKNHSCVLTKIAAKCILVVVVEDVIIQMSYWTTRPSAWLIQFISQINRFGFNEIPP